VDRVASRAIIGIKREAKVSRAARKASGMRMRCFTTRLLSIYTEQAPEELLSQKRRTNEKTVLDDWKNVRCDETRTLLAGNPIAELIRKKYSEIY
jgi:hypothetical protein